MAIQQRCIVTGGAGFIGSHLVDTLLSQGFQVIAVDNLLTGSLDNLSEARKNSSFSFINHNVIEPLSVDGEIYSIFHLASPASVIDYQKYPEETALVNSVGTRNMLQLAHEKKARILFASTSEVYGDAKVHPQKETYWGNVNPNGVRSCYDESKRYGEMMMMLYYRKFHIDTRIIRIFNTYGPRMRPTDGRVISNFINQALKNNPITVFGDGLQTRSFCFVSDLVRGIIGVMKSEKTGAQVINLGNPEEYTMIELAQKVKEFIGNTSQIQFQSLPEDDPKTRCPDITKAKELIGWKPSVSLSEGLSITAAYYKSLLQGE